MATKTFPEMQFRLTDRAALGASARDFAAAFVGASDGPHLFLDRAGMLHRGAACLEGPIEVEVLIEGGARSKEQSELAALLESWSKGDKRAPAKLAKQPAGAVLREIVLARSAEAPAAEMGSSSVSVGSSPHAAAACAPSTRAVPPPPGVPSAPHEVAAKGSFTAAPAQIAALRPYVISMARGAFEDDIMDTSPAEVARIAERIAAATKENKTVVFYAHGGLVSERTALETAWAYYDWWLAHDCYPVFFVWKTGALETLWQLVMAKLGRSRAATRDVFDYTTDPMVEGIARLPGTVEWRAMKESARLASADDGGAGLLANEIARLVNPMQARFVAVGHSAGSIFHAYFLPRLKARGFKIEHLALLAPAITHTLFEEALADLSPNTTMFAMDRATERADNCGGVYRKSLLYLVSRAFETGVGHPILGMEDFWPGETAGRVEAIFGPTGPGAPATSASGSVSHGGFDNDRKTMESVLRRFRNIEDGVVLDPRFPVTSPATARAVATPPNYYGFPEDLPSTTQPPAGISIASPEATNVQLSATAQSVVSGGGKRFALCIGNNAFGGGNDLAGCIADAEGWAASLARLGYAARVVTDATADQMRAEMRTAVAACAPGDLMVLHTSSHGTQITDEDGDEASDPYLPDTLDEVLLGCDWESGGAIIDDEIPGLLAARPGVRIVRINDFCHAGTASRMLLDRRVRLRRLNLTPAQQQRIGDVNASRPRQRGADLGEGLNLVALSACRPEQTAGEAEGMGLFTRAALELLGRVGGGISGDQFMTELSRQFEGQQQNPIIEGPARLRALPLFGGV